VPQDIDFKKTNENYGICRSEIDELRVGKS